VDRYNGVIDESFIGRGLRSIIFISYSRLDNFSSSFQNHYYLSKRNYD